MTGYEVFPDSTGPNPLDRPATAMNTRAPWVSSYCCIMRRVSSVALCAEVTRRSTSRPSSRAAVEVKHYCLVLS